MKEPQTLKFKFDTVCLVDAVKIVGAGTGNYSDVILELMQQLPKIEEANRGLAPDQQKSPRFGLPGGNPVNEKTAKGLCHSVNFALGKNGLSWVVRYIEKEKAFLCVPKIAKSYKPIARGPYKTNGVIKTKDTALSERVVAMRKAGKEYTAIQQELGLSTGTIAEILRVAGLIRQNRLGVKGSKYDEVEKLYKQGVPNNQIGERLVKMGLSGKYVDQTVSKLIRLGRIQKRSN